MVGFCALMLVMGACISSACYWISWDVLPVQRRPSFRDKLRADLAQLLKRGATRPGERPLQPAAPATEPRPAGAPRMP